MAQKEISVMPNVTHNITNSQGFLTAYENDRRVTDAIYHAMEII